MTITFKTAESFIKPERTEKVKNGYYIRQNYSTETVTDSQDETTTLTKYVYDEAFLTDDEYQIYSIGLTVANEDTSDAYLKYKTALDTGVVYSEESGGNGLSYKPKWVKEANGDDGTYISLLSHWNTLGETLVTSLPLWDASELAENVRNFTKDEFIALIAFLALKQEALFNEYKINKGQEI